jgi:hypothetical protein
MSLESGDRKRRRVDYAWAVRELHVSVLSQQKPALRCRARWPRELLISVNQAIALELRENVLQPLGVPSHLQPELAA